MSHNNFFYRLVKEAQENNKELIKTYKLASCIFLFITLSLVVAFIFIYNTTGATMYALLPPCIIPVSYLFEYNKRLKELIGRRETN